MRDVFAILFGAGFTVAVCFAVGSLLLRRVSARLYAGEAQLFAFLTGSACVSLAVFLLCVAQQARKGVFLAGGAAAIAAAVWAARGIPRRKPMPDAPAAWKYFFRAICGAFFLLYFVHALAPETSPDGSGYHLGNVMRMWHHYGFVWDYRSMYSYLSQGMEMLFLVAFSFGHHSSAALVHLAFQTALPLLMVSYGRRLGFPRVGYFGAILVYTCPVIGIDGASAYNDLALAAVVFGVFYLLQIWDETRETSILVLAGLLGGFAYGIKYTAALALPLAIGFTWWRAGLRWRNMAAVALPAAAMIAPWVLRNWLWTGNPAAPFLNAWFPSPYYHPGMEKIYLEQLRHYPDIRGVWPIARQLTLKGGALGGLLGPAFLLSPLAFIALDRSQGRRLLFAALLFGMAAFLNSGTRFLIPALPFLALAMGLGMEHAPRVLPVFAGAAALFVFPPVLARYADSWAWHVSTFPVRAALRLDREDAFLAASVTGYGLKWAVESNVPPGEKIFSFDTRPEAYIERPIVVSYESALGNLLHDILWAPIDGYIPHQRERFRFLPVMAKAIRVTQMASSDDFWTLSEVRLFSAGKEIPRSKGWRLSAWPNGWEVQLAFDNSYATRWSTWQGMGPRMFVAVEFERPQSVDEVLLEDAPTPLARTQVDVLDLRGQWVPLSDTPVRNEQDPPPGMRRAATQELKRRGIRFLLVSESNYAFPDMNKYPDYWGITQIAESQGIHLYRID
jgi:hypothetical protein